MVHEQVAADHLDGHLPVMELQLTQVNVGPLTAVVYLWGGACMADIVGADQGVGLQQPRCVELGDVARCFAASALLALQHIHSKVGHSRSWRLQQAGRGQHTGPCPQQLHHRVLRGEGAQGEGVAQVEGWVLQLPAAGGGPTSQHSTAQRSCLRLPRILCQCCSCCCVPVTQSGPHVECVFWPPDQA
jgi:hypothetical protein